MGNKAVAGSSAALGGIGIAGAIVGLFVKLCWSDADPDTISYLNTLVSALLAGPGAYFAAYLTKMEQELQTTTTTLEATPSGVAATTTTGAPTATS